MFGFLNNMVSNKVKSKNSLSPKPVLPKPSEAWKLDENKANKYDASSMVKEITSDFFTEDGRIKHRSILGKNGILKVYAPWCPHCKPLVEPLTFLAKQLSGHGFVIVAVNSENPANADLPGKLGARGFPTLFAIKPNGKLVPLEESSRDLTGLLGAICEKTKDTSSRLCCKHDNATNKIAC